MTTQERLLVINKIAMHGFATSSDPFYVLIGMLCTADQDFIDNMPEQMKKDLRIFLDPSEIKNNGDDNVSFSM